MPREANWFDKMMASLFGDGGWHRTIFSWKIYSILRENGWPISKRIWWFLYLRKRQIVTHSAIVDAANDLIRICLAMGISLPDIAKGIVLDYMDVFPNGIQIPPDHVEKFIDRHAGIVQDYIDDGHALMELPVWSRHLFEKPPISYIWEHKENQIYHSGILEEKEDEALNAMCWAIRSPKEATSALIESTQHNDKSLTRGGLTNWSYLAQQMVEEYNERHARFGEDGLENERAFMYQIRDINNPESWDIDRRLREVWFKEREIEIENDPSLDREERESSLLHIKRLRMKSEREKSEELSSDKEDQ